LVGARCRRTHLHDLRGDLQALNSSVELLVRAAKSARENAPLAEKAGALARKILLSHEKTMVELIELSAPGDEAATPVDVGVLIGEVTSFLRNDALRRSVTVRVNAAAGVSIVTHRRLCKTILVGLCAMTIDALPDGGSIDVTVGRSESLACVELKAGTPMPPIPDAAEFGACGPAAYSPFELLAMLARRWISASGGRLDVPEESPGRCALRLSHPLAST
jgi:hypothetical protein